MPKYKIVASKSQKKYTIIVSADSENEAKQKLHNENYSILSSIEVAENSEIVGKKFLFQIEKNGEIKNGIIVGEDIFKIYVKLKDELEYNVIFLFPEGDEAQSNAQKKQEIMDQLIQGYQLKKKSVQSTAQHASIEESFYIKKQLEDTYILIEKAIQKIENLIVQREDYGIEEETLWKLQKIHESLVHIKGSTNLSKLKEIWELALLKIGEIELKSLENKKDLQSRTLLKNTNDLLKKIGSKQQFIERDKDIKKIFIEFLRPLQEFLSQKEGLFQKQKTLNTDAVDTQSYSFLKTVLLLEKYKEKLSLNTREIQTHTKIFYNPFFHSEYKEKTLLKRKVIQQNISILKAKKTGGISSYTGIKKGYVKGIERAMEYVVFLKNMVFFSLNLYVLCFLWSIAATALGLSFFSINPAMLISSIIFFSIYFFLGSSKNPFLLSLNIVLFWFFYIFTQVNF